MIKTETLLLSSGAAGEAAARIAEHPVTFSRVTVGDGNGHLPTLDVTRTQLDNPVTNGEVAIIAHDIDSNDPTQRVLTLRIDNNADYDARELLIYASADGVEFPHTYIRLGAAYPVRTLANGGVSIEITAIIKVATETDFSINISETPIVDNFEQYSANTAASSRLARLLRDSLSYEVTRIDNQAKLITQLAQRNHIAPSVDVKADPNTRLDPCFVCNHLHSPLQSTKEYWWVEQIFYDVIGVENPRVQTWTAYLLTEPKVYVRNCYWGEWTDFVELSSTDAQQRADYAVEFARSNQPKFSEMKGNITAPEARYQTIVRTGGDELFIDDVYQEGDVIMIDNRNTALLTVRGELPFFFPDSADPVDQITTALFCRFSLTAKEGGFYVTPLWAKEA